MNKDTLNMMEKIDDRFIEEALTNDDVERLNESRGVKKYTVMRYAAACIVGLAGIGAAAFGIVKMNGGGKGTENIGIVGEVSENVSTKEEDAQEPTIVPNKIVINKSEAPKEEPNKIPVKPYSQLVCNVYSDFEYLDKVYENTTHMTRDEIFQYYNLEKFNSNIDGIVEEHLGKEMYMEYSPYFRRGPLATGFGICELEESYYDTNVLNYYVDDEDNIWGVKGVKIAILKNSNCWKPLGVISEEYIERINKGINDVIESESVISGQKVYFEEISVDGYKYYCVDLYVKDCIIDMWFPDWNEEEVIKFAEEVIEKGIIE